MDCTINIAQCRSWEILYVFFGLEFVCIENIPQ